MLSELVQSISFTKSESIVYDYMVNHSNELKEYNAKRLSEITGVSSSTIVRLAQKLGFKGYNELKATVIEEMTLYNSHRTKEDYKEIHIDSNTSISNIMKVLPNVYTTMFNETLKLNKSDVFNRVINYMLYASQIDFYANDNNYAEVQSACLKLNNLGIRAQAFNALNTGYIANSKPEDTLSFVVSHTGKNKTMTDIAYELRKKRHRVIAITGKQDPTLDLICNESLYIDSYLHNIPNYAVLYGMSIHYIVDILVLTMAIKKNKVK